MQTFVHVKICPDEELPKRKSQVLGLVDSPRGFHGTIYLESS